MQYPHILPHDTTCSWTSWGGVLSGAGQNAQWLLSGFDYYCEVGDERGRMWLKETAKASAVAQSKMWRIEPMTANLTVLEFIDRYTSPRPVPADKPSKDNAVVSKITVLKSIPNTYNT